MALGGSTLGGILLFVCGDVLRLVRTRGAGIVSRGLIVSRVLRRIRVIDRSLLELLLADRLLAVSRLLVRERLRLLIRLRRHSALQLRSTSGAGDDTGLLGVVGRMSGQREAEVVADVCEGGNEQEHDESADTSDSAQDTERAVRGDADDSLFDDAVATVDGAAVADAVRAHGDRELASSIGGRRHSRQPEDYHE